MLDNKQKKFLQSLAQSRKTIIWIGQHGLTENVIREIDAALDHHELIKVRIRAGGRDERDQLIERLCRECRAEPVQRVGNVIALYRRHPDKPRIALPAGGFRGGEPSR